MDLFVVAGAAWGIYKLAMERHRLLNNTTPPNPQAVVKIGDTSQQDLGVNTINHPESNKLGVGTVLSEGYLDNYQDRLRARAHQTDDRLNKKLTHRAGVRPTVTGEFIHEPVTAVQYDPLPTESMVQPRENTRSYSIQYANHGY